VIELNNIGKTFRGGGGETAALTEVSLTIKRGEVFGIIGRSGAGKSTLIRMLNQLERPTTGKVVVEDVDVTALKPAELRAFRRRVGMIFQHFGLLSSQTVADNVAYPLKLEGKLDANAIKARVAQLLERVGLSDQARKYPAQLSGGQKQRVGIARALATGPDILLCDEATSALDPETTREVLSLIASLNRELGLTVVLITHAMEVVRQVCDRVAVLDAGRLVESGPAVDVLLHPQHAATKLLVAEAVLGDEPPAPVQGRVVRLSYVGDTAHEPVLARVARETGVDISILSGRVSRIKDAPYGQLTVALDAAHAEAAIAGLKAAGVRVEAA
jgi:D-methionine transport system ATP-binding protein